jgi:hypothetical protein
MLDPSEFTGCRRPLYAHAGVPDMAADCGLSPAEFSAVMAYQNVLPLVGSRSARNLREGSGGIKVAITVQWVSAWSLGSAGVLDGLSPALSFVGRSRMRKRGTDFTPPS